MLDGMIDTGGANAPVAETPFHTYLATRPATVQAVCLRQWNIPQVAWVMLQDGGGFPLYIPSTRDYIEWNGMEFGLGSWIIRERRGILCNFRHATEEERDTFSLKEAQ